MEEETGAVLKNNEHDTITGLVFHSLGYVPDDGAYDIEIDAGPFHIRVLKILEHQVFEATVQYIKASDETEEGMNE